VARTAPDHEAFQAIPSERMEEQEDHNSIFIVLPDYGRPIIVVG
jgi:hypothetical protein